MNTPCRAHLSLLPVAAAALLCTLAPGAGATPLNNGFGAQAYLDTPLPGTKAVLRPELAGVVLADVLTPFTVGTVSGVVQNRVVRENGTGTLDFYWRVEVDPAATGTGVSAFRLTDFGYGYLTDADWRIDGTGTIPATTARLFNPGPYPQGDVNFLFDPTVDGGESSSFFFLHTSATNYAETAGYDLLVGPGLTLSGAFSTFAPAVPEPTPAALLALGLLTLGWLRGRRSPARD
jgi:hypothetical protein